MRIPERFLLSALLLALVTLLLFTSSLWRLDQLFYDWGIRQSTRQPGADILIVAIDEQSLRELGRWPWSRSVHADLVRKLSTAGARVIGLDILFTEAENAGADNALAHSMTESGRVVLPVANEQQRPGGQLVETLPLPELMRAAAAIGHVDRQLDPDAIVRSTYLKAGLGSAHWSSFALAMLEAGAAAPREIPGLRRAGRDAESPLVWVRDHQIWIPYAGPPGTMRHVSYVDVLRERIPKEHIDGAFVVVGATAVGLGDLLPTPLSGHSQPMPGVEIVANELDTLRRQLAILPLSPVWTWIVSMLLVFVPTALYPRTPRWSLGVWGGCIALNILFSMTLLSLKGLWFAPASALIAQFVSYPMWSWRRLVQTVIYLNRALQSLHAERVVPNTTSVPSLDQSMAFLGQLTPIRGAVLLDANNAVRETWGETPAIADLDSLPADHWRIDGCHAWIRLGREPHACFFGVRWADDARPDEQTLGLLQPLTANLAQGPETGSPRGVVEYIQRRIQQVQIATDKIQFMRRFVTDTLAEMAQGIVVTDGVGDVVLANPRAETYLGLAPGESLVGRPVTEYLFELSTYEGQSWSNALRTVMIDEQPLELAARTKQGLHLLIQMSPFTYDTNKSRGLLLSFADVSALRGSERQRRELVTFISHDLRSPLSSILAITGIARIDPGKLDPSAIARIEENAYKTLALADDFLEFNRAEATEPGELRPVNLAAIAHQAVDSASDQALAKDIRLERQLPDEAGIRGDARLLERTFGNLLENAIKYSDPGDRVTLSIHNDARVVRCIVEDTGYGIGKDNIERIFDKFQRVENPNHPQRRGSGLGLSFVRTVVDLHGGEINVDSEPDVGSRFTLTFPRDGATTS